MVPRLEAESTKRSPQLTKIKYTRGPAFYVRVVQCRDLGALRGSSEGMVAHNARACATFRAKITHNWTGLEIVPGNCCSGLTAIVENILLTIASNFERSLI